MFLVGLAVVLALVLGVAAAALGAPMILLQARTDQHLKRHKHLVGAVPGSNLKIENTGTNANATALELKVPQGNAPLTINAGAQGHQPQCRQAGRPGGLARLPTG